MSGRSLRTDLFLLTLIAIAAQPLVADQAASFSCRATQGWAWQGQSAVTREHIAITIHPDHLDVEHELEIDARSWGTTPSHPQSLEIFGSLYVEKGTVMTGLLLWNGNKILKGKLQTKEMARRKYEDVVDRNVKNPPPPRDPAILEKVGEGTYALSIFPVSLNGSRKLRIRYLVPSAFQGGAHRIPFPHAFSRIASVTLKGGPGTPGYALTSLRRDGTETTVKNEDAAAVPLTLDADVYNQFHPYAYWHSSTGALLRHITPLFGGSAGSRVYTGAMRDSRGSLGHVTHFVFRPPADFADFSPGATTRIVAVIKTAADSIKKEVGGGEYGRLGVEELRVFSRDTLEEGVSWRLYLNGALERETVEKPLVVRMTDGDQFARSFGGVPFYPLVKTMPVSLAAAWGFIDSKYALLALEEDSLKQAVADQFAKAGVPALDPEDIYPEDGKLDSIPLTAWMLQKNFNRDDLLAPSAIEASGPPPGIRWAFRDGSLSVEIDAAARGRGVRVSLHGLDGKLLKEWGANDMSKGRLAWSPKHAGYSAGLCLLRIVSGSQVYSIRVILR